VGEVRTRYFTNLGVKGTLKAGQVPFTIGVVDARDNHAPIAVAFGHRTE
jgi:hypothetical protein